MLHARSVLPSLECVAVIPASAKHRDRIVALVGDKVQIYALDGRELHSFSTAKDFQHLPSTDESPAANAIDSVRQIFASMHCITVTTSNRIVVYDLFGNIKRIQEGRFSIVTVDGLDIASVSADTSTTLTITPLPIREGLQESTKSIDVLMPIACAALGGSQYILIIDNQPSMTVFDRPSGTPLRTWNLPHLPPFVVCQGQSFYFFGKSQSLCKTMISREDIFKMLGKSVTSFDLAYQMFAYSTSSTVHCRIQDSRLQFQIEGTQRLLATRSSLVVCTAAETLVYSTTAPSSRKKHHRTQATPL